MFHALDNAKQALLKKLASDNDHKDFLLVLEDFFAHEKNLHERHNETLLHEQTIFSQYLNDLENKFKKDISNLEFSNIENLTKIESMTSEAKSSFSKQINTLENDYLSEKEKLESSIQSIENQYKNSIKVFQQEYNKSISSIKKQIEQIKSNHTKAIQNIEVDKQDNTIKIKTDYDTKKALLSEKKDTLKNLYNEKLTGLQNVRFLQSKAHDDDYIKIKTHYNQLLKSLNQHINQLKQLKDDTIKKLNDYYQEKQIPIHDALDHYQLQTKEEQHTLQLKLEKDIQVVLEKKEREMEAYHEQLHTIHASTAQAVSLLNSKLSNFRELTEVKKKDILKSFHAKSEQEKYKDVANKNQKLRTFDNELNHLILSIRKQIKQKKLEGELLLFELNKQHQIQMNHLYYEHKKLQLDYNLSIKKIKLLNEQHQKHSDDKIYRLLQLKKQFIQLLEFNFQFELSRFETQLSIAVESQERDLNQLSQDVFIDLTITDIDIENHQHAYALDTLKIQSELTVLELNYAFDSTLLELQTNRLLERENLVKSLKLEEQNIRLQLAENIQKRHVLDDEKIHNQKLLHIQKELKYLDFKYQHDIELLKIDHDYQILKRDFSKQEHNLKVHSRREKMSFSHEQNRHILTMEKQYNIIKQTLFKLLHDKKLIEKMKTFITILYDKPAHPETIREFLAYYHTYLEHLQEDATSVFNETENQVLNLNQEHIEAIITQLHDKLILKIETDYDEAKEKINTLEINLNKKLYELEINIKQQKTTHLKNDSLYLKIKKEKSDLMLRYDVLDKLKAKKIRRIEYQIQRQKQSLLRYLNALKHTFNAYKQSQKFYYKHQIYMVQQLQNQLYITKSILESQLKSASKHDDTYHQKQIFYMQSLYETLLLQYQHMTSVEEKTKQKHDMDFETDLQLIKKQYDLILNTYHKNINQKHILFDAFKHDITHDYELSIKQLEDGLMAKNQELSQRINKDEEVLQQFSKYYEKSFDYFDLNTTSLHDKLSRSHLLELDQHDKQLHDDIQKQENHHKILHEQLQTKIKSTETNIESRLHRYRQKVEKLRETLSNKESSLQSEVQKTKRIQVKKVIGSKKRTKKLLNRQQKELSHFQYMTHQQGLRLVKYSQNRLKYNLKTVSRGYRFKSKMMDLS